MQWFHFTNVETPSWTAVSRLVGISPRCHDIISCTSWHEGPLLWMHSESCNVTVVTRIIAMLIWCVQNTQIQINQGLQKRTIPTFYSEVLQSLQSSNSWMNQELCCNYSVKAGFETSLLWIGKWNHKARFFMNPQFVTVQLHRTRDVCQQCWCEAEHTYASGLCESKTRIRDI